MNPDDFERQLQRQTFRPVPVEWRAEILAAGTVAAIARPPARKSLLVALCLELVWPYRRIWAGLAVAWMVIVVSNLMAGNGVAPHTAQARASDPEIRMAIMERRQLMVQLLEPGAPEAIVPPKRQEPRSELSEPTSLA